MIRLLGLAVVLVLAARPSMGQQTCKNDGDGIYEVYDSKTGINVTFEVDMLGSYESHGTVHGPEAYVFYVGDSSNGILPNPVAIVSGDYDILERYLQANCGEDLGEKIYQDAATSTVFADAGSEEDAEFMAQKQGHGLRSQAALQYPLVGGQASQYVALADLNGDGFPDEIGVSPAGVTIRLLAGDGSVITTKVFPAGFTPGVQTSQVVAADFNGDGNLDLAITYSDSTGAGGVSILLGNGDGTFGSAKVSSGVYAAGFFAQMIAAADFNGDGRIDIALANTNKNAATTVAILLGNGDGTFAAPFAYPAGPGFPVSLLALDLNGDGAPDLAVANILASGTQGNVTTLINTGAKFAPPSTTSLPIRLEYLAYTDLNHDGNLDLVGAALHSNAIVVLSGKGDGTFQAPAAYAVAAYPASLYPLPFSDGYTVIFTADDISGSTRFTIVSPQGVVYAPRLFPVGGSPTGIAAADLNGDGFPDVVVTGGSSDVSVVMAQSARLFKSPVGYSLGQTSPAPLAVAIGDFNGDGKPDVIVANGGAGYPTTTGPGSVSVLLGNGDGTLRAPTSTTVNQNARSLALGDFNRDGKLDAAVAAYGTLAGEPGSDPGALVTLRGNGDGTFQLPISLATGGLHPTGVAAADLNGDGILDLAAVMQGALFAPATLAIFLGQGNGTFAAPRTFPLLSAGGPLAIGDFNRDGRLDIATGTDIMLGDGAGGFSEGPILSVTDGSVAATMDLNADGNLDLVLLSCCGESEGSYMLGNGDGTFQPAVHFASGSSTTAIGLTRFSGSNGPDFVITQQGGTWTPFLGATFQTGNSGPTQYPLTITASPAAGGTVTPATGTSYASGTVVPITATPASGYQFTGWTGPVASASSASTTVTMNAAETVTANFTATGHPAFFNGEDFLSGTAYYLQFPNNNLFGYYEYLSSSILYHFDMGYEAFIPGSGGQIYFYDFATGHWWYSSPSLFPYLYDFALNTFIYYFPDTKNAGHYTTNPRYFSNLTTGKIFTM